MPTKFDRLQTLLAELFQLDRGDLDFGIYRIMNLRRDEIARFLRDELLPQVRVSLAGHQPAGRAEIEAELRQAEQQAQALGVDPAGVPKVQGLRERLAAYGTDVTGLEDEVYSHLYDFFRRYYDEGDFISVRRYKEGVYAIPYEGEEVKLHWANADQYYVKTSENFRDYTFRLPSGRRVHFKLMEAEADRDNVKAAEGKDRRFVLAGVGPGDWKSQQPSPSLPAQTDSQPAQVGFAEVAAVSNRQDQGDELVILFEYRADPDKRKQAELNGLAAAAVLAAAPDGWTAELRTPAPTAANPRRTLLDKHLADYTARNSFDYFIHKDLRSFLRRELDFYIKNEVVRLDDIESETAPRVEAYLGKVRALRQVAHKIIDFLAQSEELQKRLWLKKKFVVETNYCVTLDRVPEALYGEIAASDAQREEWVRLFAIDEIAGDLVAPAYSAPLTVEFLKANPFLVLDTKFFDARFRDRLVGSFDDLDAQTDGLLVHSENFQALELLAARYRGQVKCTHIDPPYNSKTTEIAYKNSYKHSSWMTLMASRLAVSARLATDDGSHVVAIDENEQEVLGQLLSQQFPAHEKVCIAVVHNKKGIQGDYFSYNHEYAFFCIPRMLPATNGTQVPRAEWEFDNLRKWGRESERETARNCFYPIFVENDQIVGFGDVCSVDFHPGKANLHIGDRTAVYPVDSQGIERKRRYARDSVPKILPLLKIHVTGSGEVQIHKAKAERAIKTVWNDSRYIAGDYGTKWLTDLGIKITETLYPKSVHTVEDSVAAVSDGGELVLDYFAGSGTTGHAVVILNRKGGHRRRFVLVEMSDYFDTILKPRMLKVAYSRDWSDGKPVSREGSSHLFKYVSLESYEDTLNNLAFRPPEGAQLALAQHPEFREDYTLRYMLDAESRDSLLNVRAFEDPFAYSLNIATGIVGETLPLAVDLVETFNYLLGLRVRHVDVLQGYRVVQGLNPQGERVLVLWRNLKEKSNRDLETFFRKQDYNPRDMEFDLIYVNGDNHLENLRRPDETWKVRLIEEEFMRLMFDVRDV